MVGHGPYWRRLLLIADLHPVLMSAQAEILNLQKDIRKHAPTHDNKNNITRHLKVLFFVMNWLLRFEELLLTSIHYSNSNYFKMSTVANEMQECFLNVLERPLCNRL